MVYNYSLESTGCTGRVLDSSRTSLLSVNGCYRGTAVLRFFFTSLYLQAFAKGLELDAGNVDLQEGAKAARLDLTLEELHQVRFSLTRHNI